MLKLNYTSQQDISPLSFAIITAFDILHRSIDDLDKCIQEVTNHILHNIIIYSHINKNLLLEAEKNAKSLNLSLEKYIYKQVEFEIEAIITTNLVYDVKSNNVENEYISLEELKKECL